MLRNRIPWTQSRVPGVLLVFSIFCPLLYAEKANNILIGTPAKKVHTRYWCNVSLLHYFHFGFFMML